MYFIFLENIDWFDILKFSDHLSKMGVWKIKNVNNSCIIALISILNYSYIVHCGTEMVEVGQGGPGHVVQQVDVLGASSGLVVSDLIC